MFAFRLVSFLLTEPPVFLDAVRGPEKQVMLHASRLRSNAASARPVASALPGLKARA
jgi:hypothetical protein